MGGMAAKMVRSRERETVHSFRAKRRRLAIDKKEVEMQQMRNEIQWLRRENLRLQHELGLWQEWWIASTSTFQAPTTPLHNPTTIIEESPIEEAERKAKEEAESKAKEEAESKAKQKAEEQAKEEVALKRKQEQVKAKQDA